ncbi:putative membrane protein [Streptomyces scabiei 87.22]|uniref:Putative membrane protein n=4 Tax=Streptomyces scabiei TaxID=1930 RepID=C9YUM7_STRSW|nr:MULTISPECIES: PDZ domain-containing protein [Streptomyces]MBP5860390.1 PDZ domain-containing protein [Streptomyces sp. LBUM 1484]MBP5879247.1 PDZ domain-containing protein [Streptomyces sp. LBUM 1477]MBP5887071.1 PDZ domain-containing protein [Streptomyces sp. LBUM 1487]MBP5890344.1 PDZ domain-containing protein [Streptomyces sp. LBUM 1481]MBP5903068.1 PDZ domain-containing protein [Streptomyces sp. LBUM 1488]
MEQTALRPKPLPGRESGDERPPGAARRPHAAPRRARQRLITLLSALVTCVILVLSGVGLGTMGVTVIGMGRPAQWREPSSADAARPDDGRSRTASTESASQRGSSLSTVPVAAVRPTLGVDVVDAPGDARGRGALVAGVHVPGAGYRAGLVRGDVVLSLGGTRTGTAADLARAVAAARPGTALRLAVRHANGTRQYLVAVPGVAT